jgi:hypothetical protein
MEPKLSKALIQPTQSKRCLEEGIPAPYAAYGMVTGQLSTSLDLAPSCGIISSGWPSWAISANFRGWNVKVIIHKQSMWSHRLVLWFPNAMVLDVNDVPDHLIQSLGLGHWFCDVNPPRKLGLWYSDAHIISCLRRARHVPISNWMMTRHELSHGDIGGLADGKWSLYHYMRNEVWHLRPMALNSPRDLRCILNTTIDGRPCPPPKPLTSTSPTVTVIRPNSYHGSGILPLFERNCFVITPCMFLPTAWARR